MITNQILSSKLCTQVKYTLFWNTFKKETEKRIYNFLWNYKKNETSQHMIQLSILKGGLVILDIYTQSKTL